VRPRREILTILYRYKEAKGWWYHSSNNDSIGCNNIQQEEDRTYDDNDDADEDLFASRYRRFYVWGWRKKNTYDNKDLRVAIGVLFAKCHDAIADKGMWSGPYGVRAEVQRSLDLDPRHNVDRVFEAVLECKEKGTRYNGARVFSAGKTAGRNPTIALDSHQAQIIADEYEGGLNTTQVQFLVNQHQKDANMPSYTKWTECWTAWLGSSQQLSVWER
jgi:hypothetical protein